MERRDFIKRTAIASGAFMMPKFLSASTIFESQPIATQRKLVIIQLSGGNDGLNTIVPFRNDLYYQNRSGIALRKEKLLYLNDTYGFHDSLKNMRSLFNNGELTILNNVGYPNPNRSHFRATDIWQTASSSEEYLQTGWVGRYIDYKKVNPYSAIEVDDSLSLLMKGKELNGIATKNAQLFYRTTQDPYFKKVLSYYHEEHLSEHNLGYLYKTMIEAKNSANYIYEKSKVYKSSVSYPQNRFGKQLKTVAEFINSGLETEIYYVSLGGFDTHANQLNTQKRLLEVYDTAIATFIKDLKQAGTFDDTLIMTFSEFGRRVKQNAARGTDHGTANQVFVMGINLKKQGMFNEGPDLNNLDTNGDLQYSLDFRNIYATLIDDWLGVASASILNDRFNSLGLV
ncbi:MAG: DUF1501 domain-containing protein [Flavobacteriaceae bacterium]|nr:DUF1501 domain-containing protein [Flavobacteriaceae bacterium]